MSEYKRVLILAANVHDGLGGEFFRGDRPVLPAEIADLFIARNLASLDAEMSPEEAKRIATELEDARRQTFHKEHAEAVMRRHDSLPKELRIESHEHQVPLVKPDDMQIQEQPENVVPMPKRRGRPRKEAG